MSSYVTIAQDGSRTVDVQSLFYDQIEMVRRIARMDLFKSDIAESEKERMLKRDIGAASDALAAEHAALIAAQQRIAKLEAERNDYRERWEQTGCTRHAAMESAIKLAESYRQQLDDMAAKRDRLIDELRDAEARNVQKLQEIARLREALSRTIHDCESVPYKDGAHRCDFRIKIDAILQRSRAALESGDE